MRTPANSEAELVQREAPSREATAPAPSREAHAPEFPGMVDSTILNSWRACPLKAYFNHFLHLAPEVSVDLHAGAAFASALERTRRAFWKEKLSESAALARGVETLIREWGDFEPPEGHVKNLHSLTLALVEYYEHFGFRTDHIQPLQTPNGPAIEFSFAIPLDISHPVTGDPILYAGRFDMIGESSMGLVVVDEKTTRAFQKNWAELWDMRGQLIGYVMAARLAGYKVTGAVVRGIAIHKYDTEFLEVHKSYPEHLISAWWDEIHYRVCDMIAAWRSGHYSRSFGDACTAYFRPCPYTPPCRDARPEVWYDTYEVRKWSPLTKVI